MPNGTFEYVTAFPTTQLERDRLNKAAWERAKTFYPYQFIQNNTHNAPKPQDVQKRLPRVFFYRVTFRGTAYWGFKTKMDRILFRKTFPVPRGTNVDEE